MAQTALPSSPSYLLPFSFATLGDTFSYSKSDFTCSIAARSACGKRPRHTQEVLSGTISSVQQSTSGQAALLVPPVGAEVDMGWPALLGAEAEAAEELSAATLMPVGAIDHPLHRFSSQTDSYRYQTLIIRHRAHSHGASFIVRGMTRRGGVLHGIFFMVYFCNAHPLRSVPRVKDSATEPESSIRLPRAPCRTDPKRTGQ